MDYRRRLLRLTKAVAVEGTATVMTVAMGTMEGTKGIITSGTRRQLHLLIKEVSITVHRQDNRDETVDRMTTDAASMAAAVIAIDRNTEV
jgi:hypothetical protein